MAGATPAQRRFAARLDQLFSTRVRPDGARVTFMDLVRWVEAHYPDEAHFPRHNLYRWLDPDHTPRGPLPLPRVPQLEAIAAFFGVPVTFFFEDTATDDALGVPYYAVQAGQKTREAVRTAALIVAQLDQSQRQRALRILHKLATPVAS